MLVKRFQAAVGDMNDEPLGEVDPDDQGETGGQE